MYCFSKMLGIAIRGHHYLYKKSVTTIIFFFPFIRIRCANFDENRFNHFTFLSHCSNYMLNNSKQKNHTDSSYLFRS